MGGSYAPLEMGNPATARWREAHNAACILPNSVEQPIIFGISALRSLCRDYNGDGYVVPNVIVPMAQALLSMLNLELGRLDGGTLDHCIRANCEMAGGKLE